MRPNDLIHAQGCYSSSAPSEGSSAVSTFESRFMLMAWISAIRCLNVVPSRALVQIAKADRVQWSFWNPRRVGEQAEQL